MGIPAHKPRLLLLLAVCLSSSPGCRLDESLGGYTAGTTDASADGYATGGTGAAAGTAGTAGASGTTSTGGSAGAGGAAGAGGTTSTGGSAGAGGIAGAGGLAGAGGAGGAAGQAGDGGSSGSAGCAPGQPATIAHIADGDVSPGVRVSVAGAVATTRKALLYFGKDEGTCLWGLFVRDPIEARGMVVISYGSNAPADSWPSDCPVGTDGIEEGIVPGNEVDIVGETTSYVSSQCPATTPPQTQILACSVVKAAAGAAPTPVVVTDLDGLASGLPQYQGLLVRIQNVDAENYDGGTVGPYGAIELQGTDLQVHDILYYRENGGPDFPPSQHFDSIVGVSHLDHCNWVIQPRDKCYDFDPKSNDCS